MSATCSGLRKNNQPCRCLRFIPKNGEDEDGPRRCRDCRHTEGCHPGPQAVATAAPRNTIQDIIDRYSIAERFRKSSPPTLSMAREETNAGLIGAQGSVGKGSRGKKKSKASSSGQRGPSKMMKVGMLVMIPCGLNVSIYLQRSWVLATDTLTSKTGV